LPRRTHIDARASVTTLTNFRPNADASLTTHRVTFATLHPHRVHNIAQHPMSTLETITELRSSATLHRVPLSSARVVAMTLAASLALALAGCATPVLEQKVDVPSRFAAAPTANDEPEVSWWDGYSDPVLSDLVRRAAHENRDVKIAAERVRAARSGETISRSWLFPNVGIQGAGFDHRTGYDSSTKQTVPEAANTKGWQGGLEVSWEIDIAGRLRAGAAASAADTRAAEYTASGVRLLVISDVATNYFMLVGALRQLDSVRAISAAHDETLRLVSARQRAGLATPFDVERAQTEASRARAAIPPLETIAAVSRHRIAVLIGDQAFNASSIVPSRGDVTVPTARAGQPAALLQRRPDLLAAQAQLDAANARRQQAMAEWFPRLILGAMFGGEGLSVNGMALGAARFTNVAALIAMPIFNAGRTQAINDIAESGQREAVLRYEDAIVRALEDVENTLVALDDERQRSQLLQSAAASADSALGRAQTLYDRGQIDLLPLLDAQRVRLSVRIGSNDANTQLLLDSVQLYKALGGGWQVFEPSGTPTAANDLQSPHS
jgi:multidrug efflux system outer membrane protein